MARIQNFSAVVRAGFTGYFLEVHGEVNCGKLEVQPTITEKIPQGINPKILMLEVYPASDDQAENFREATFIKNISSAHQYTKVELFDAQNKRLQLLDVNSGQTQVHKQASRTIKLKNNRDVPLQQMKEEEIREMVIKQADTILAALPEELRIAEVNSVQLESNLKQVADTGVWAQWTRACCDRRKRIEDFVDPASDELRIDNPQVENAVFQNHFDSNFSIRQVTEQESLKKIGSRNQNK